jgi:hypothetical protein
MRLKKVGRSVLAAVIPLVLACPVLADVSGHVQARYLINDIDKISRDQPSGDHAVNKKKAEAFGYFTHTDYTGLYGGFYLAREKNYRQGFETVGPNDFRNNVMDRPNTIQEIYLGKTYFADFGELGAEVMLGKESVRDGLKYRPKVHGRYEFANGLSISGYGMVLVQNYDGPSQSVAADREFLETELQPGVGYKINDHMGMWVNARLRDRTQQRALYGDLKEKERFVELGLWKNFGELYTSLRVRSGTFEMWDTLSYQDSTRNTTIRQDKINRLVGSISLPLASKLRALVDVGYLWENYDIVRAGAVSKLRAPILAVGLRFEL